MTPTFIMQSVISSAVLGFALFQFANSKVPGDKPIYASWVGLVVGYWLPSPNSKKEEGGDTTTHTYALSRTQAVTTEMALKATESDHSNTNNSDLR